MVQDNSDLRESVAFKEYQTSKRLQIKTPWWWIIIVGIITALASILTNVFASVAYGNPWALNFIIGLYGIPAGIIIAFRNKTLSFLVSFRYSSYSALVFTVFFFILGVILTIAQVGTIGQFFIGIGGFFLSSLIIGLYTCFSFGLGALLGTIAHGVRDDKR